MIAAQLGEKDQAFAFLERAYQERSGWIPWLKLDPMSDPLREDVRFVIAPGQEGVFEILAGHDYRHPTRSANPSQYRELRQYLTVILPTRRDLATIGS